MSKLLYILLFFVLNSFFLLSADNGPRIRAVHVEGNRYCSTDAILSRLPYRADTYFEPYKSSDAIAQLYQLGYFKQICIEKEAVENDEIDLFITVEEKNRLEKIKCTGNHTLSKKKIVEKLKLDQWEMIDEEDLEFLKKELLAAYSDEGHYFAQITASLIPNPETLHKVTLQFDIEEGVRSHVMRVEFEGNNAFDSDKLRTIVNTRERWILSGLDGSGRYNPELIEYDKYVLGRFYQDHGYLLAKVRDVKVTFSDDKKEIYITYFIDEKKVFHVSSVNAPGDEIMSEENLTPHLLIHKGQPFSMTRVHQTMERLRSLWTDKGYLYADLYPQIKPNEESGTVDITFYCEHGNKVCVNRIDITGNKVTSDSLIRRQIDFEEGDIVTARKLERSKSAVERLSYFERGGVNWKMHRIDDTATDLELNVKETKTGRFQIRGSFGSQENSNGKAFRVGLDLEKRNFMGEGIDLGTELTLQIAKHGSQFFEAHAFHPYLFNTNFSGRACVYHKKQEFTEWRNVNPIPTILQFGGALNFGREFSLLKHNVGMDFEVGGELLYREKRWVKDPNDENKEKHVTDLSARGSTADEIASFQRVIDLTFQESGIQWFGLSFGLDTRNHRIYPTEGYRLMQSNKLALPVLNSNYAYFKSEIEGSYYTPLIGEDSLVLALRARAGTVHPLGDKAVPYTELFNIGGQTTVRGFAFGSIGPAWKNQDPLGAKHALIFNAEIIFPLLRAYQMKGHFFYDAGAGWDTPSSHKNLQPDLITRNNFNVRHAVGFGINLMQPQPIKIDWGFKLDRNKKAGESNHEMHISANIAF